MANKHKRRGKAPTPPPRVRPHPAEDVVQKALREPLVTAGTFVRAPDEVARAGRTMEWFKAVMRGHRPPEVG